MAKKWIVILTKAGNEDTSQLLKKAIDVKVKLEQTEIKARSLGDDLILVKKKKGKKAASKAEEELSDDDDDDEFEEVEDKVDYEKSTERDGLLEMVFLRSEQDHGGGGGTSSSESKPGPSRPREKA